MALLFLLFLAAQLPSPCLQRPSLCPSSATVALAPVTLATAGRLSDRGLRAARSLPTDRVMAQKATATVTSRTGVRPHQRLRYQRRSRGGGSPSSAAWSWMSSGERPFTRAIGATPGTTASCLLLCTCTLLSMCPCLHSSLWFHRSSGIETSFFVTYASYAVSILQDVPRLETSSRFF